MNRKIAAVLVGLAVLLAAPALAAVVTEIPAEGDIPVTTDETPTITLGEVDQDIDPLDFFDGDQLTIAVDEGEMNVSGDDGASARIAVNDIEGDQTELTSVDAGSNWIEVDPADKNRLDLRGDVDALAFADLGIDDGETDIQLSGSEGGLAELRVYDLPTEMEFAWRDTDTEQILGTFETDTQGEATSEIDMPDGSHSLELVSVDDLAEPELSDPDPQGEVTELPERLEVSLEADAYPAEVTFFLEGDEVDSAETTSDGEVSVPVDIDDLGEYEWSAQVEDAAGQTDEITAQFETPRELTIREEHEPETIIEDSNVEIRFFSSAGDIVIQDETDDGTLDMEGLPNTDFVVFVQSDDHYDRSVYLGSIFEQENIYLLNEEEFPRGENDAIRSNFVYEDLTGQFPREETTIQIQRAIDLDGDGQSEFRTVAGDFWGAGGEYEAVLERGERYRLLITNQETGQTDILGTHIPTEDLTYELRTSGLVQEAQNESGVTALAELDDEDNVIQYAYSDPSDETESLNVVIESRSGDDIIYDETITGPLGSASNVVQLDDEQAEQDWVVRFDSERHTSSVPVGSGSIGMPIPLPDWVLTLSATLAVTFVGALYGPRTALLGAWSMVFVAGGISMFGWAFSSVSVLVAALVAVAATFMARATF